MVRWWKRDSGRSQEYCVSGLEGGKTCMDKRRDGDGLETITYGNFDARESFDGSRLSKEVRVR